MQSSVSSESIQQKPKRGRPRGSGLGKYAGKEAKASASVRKYWRDYYHRKKE